MRAILLAVVTLAVALPVPVAAQQLVSDVRFTGRSGKTAHHGGFDRHDRHDRDDRRRHRDRDDNDVFFYDNYRDYQGDSAWQSDSFNDWWHERPDRAYPRWMTNNQNCQRQWWGGDTLRC